MTIFRKILLFCPFIVSLSALLYASFSWYFIGCSFERDIMAFRLFDYILTMVLFILLAFLLSCFTLYKTYRCMSTGVKYLSISAIIVSLILAILIMPAINIAYDIGRNDAYDSIDCKTLVDECYNLTDFLDSEKNDMKTCLLYTYDEKYKMLPDYIKKLNPLFVYIERSAIVIQMAGGGIKSHEGVFVVLEPSVFNVGNIAQQDGIVVLNSEYNIFRYHLYDFRVLPLSLE